MDTLVVNIRFDTLPGSSSKRTIVESTPILDTAAAVRMVNAIGRRLHSTGCIDARDGHPKMIFGKDRRQGVVEYLLEEGVRRENIHVT